MTNPARLPLADGIALTIRWHGESADVSILNRDPFRKPHLSQLRIHGRRKLVFQVPEGMTGAGKLLATYHGELPSDALYAALGLAASSDDGLHWTDLGEIIRLNQAYTVGLDGFEIGDGPLVLSPDGKYFYLYFPGLRPPTAHCTPRMLRAFQPTTECFGCAGAG